MTLNAALKGPQMVSRKYPLITPEEKTLFQKAMQNGEYLYSLSHLKKTSHQTKPLQIHLEDLSYSEQHRFTANDNISFKRTGCQYGVLKKLQLGKFPPQAFLDMHGMTVEQARNAIIQFIQSAHQNHYKSVIVIHGKGVILKNYSYHWLTQINNVIAICSALPKDGGTGAMVVLLKSH